MRLLKICADGSAVKISLTNGVFKKSGFEFNCSDNWPHELIDTETTTGRKIEKNLLNIFWFSVSANISR